MSRLDPRPPATGSPDAATGSPDAAAQTDSGKGMLNLPNEIMDMISDELPPPSRIAFALSCKSIFAALSSTRALQGLSRQELVEALRLLERDVPSHFLCFGCLRLRPWKPTNRIRWRGQAHEKCGGTVRCRSFKYRVRKRGDPPRSRPREGEGSPIRCIFFPLTIHRLAWRPRAEGPEIFFSEAYQVMNRHRLGEGFGLPLESLERQFYCERQLTLDDDEVATDHFSLQKFAHERRPLTRHLRDRIIEGPAPEPGAGQNLDGWPSPSAELWKFTHEYKAKIIEGELFICRYHRVTGPPVELGKFVKLLHDLALPVCQHLFTRTKAPEYFRRIPAHAEWRYPRIDSRVPAFEGIPYEYFSSIGPEVGSCSICFTDYTIQIDIREGQRKLELITYHLLGSCVSPDDPVWSNLTSLDTYLPAFYIPRPFRMFPTGDVSLRGPGSVRGRWCREEGDFRELGAVWAGWDKDSVPFHWTHDMAEWDWRGFGFRNPRVPRGYRGYRVRNWVT